MTTTDQLQAWKTELRSLAQRMKDAEAVYGVSELRSYALLNVITAADFLCLELDEPTSLKSDRPNFHIFNSFPPL